MILYKIKTIDSEGIIYSSYVFAEKFDEFKASLFLNRTLLKFRKASKLENFFIIYQLKKDIYNFCFHLKIMTSVGISTFEAVKSYCGRKEFIIVTNYIQKKLIAGDNLGKIILNFPFLFSPLMRSLISAGEKVGNFNASFTQICNYMQFKREVKIKLNQALKYPLLNFILILIVGKFLISIILPEVMTFIDEQNNYDFRAMHGALIYFFDNLCFNLTSSGFLICLCIFLYKKFGLIQLLTFRILYNIPIVSSVMIYKFQVEFFKILILLNSAGFTIIQSIHYIRDNASNKYIEKELNFTLDEILMGNELHNAIDGKKVFSGNLVQFLKTATSSNKYSEIFKYLELTIEEKFNSKISGLCTFLNITLLSIAAGILAWFYITVLSPIYTMI